MLPLQRYRLQLHATAMPPRTLRRPEQAGPVWRSAFGKALRDSVCLLPAGSDCQRCPRLHDCAYTELFETPVPPHAPMKRLMRHYPHAPHPLVLSPVETAPTERTLLLDFTLIGRGNRRLHCVLHALRRASANGLGAGRCPLRLDDLQQETAAGWRSILDDGRLRPLPLWQPPCPGEAPAAAELQLHTPLRLKHGGRSLGPGEFSFAALVANLLRRVSALAAFHADGEPELDYAGLVRRAASIAISHNRLRWQDGQRWSQRQQRQIPLGGVTGSLRLDGDLSPWWPLLWAGQHIHAGAGTIMGLGRYSLHPHPPTTDGRTGDPS